MLHYYYHYQLRPTRAAVLPLPLFFYPHPTLTQMGVKREGCTGYPHHYYYYYYQLRPTRATLLYRYY